jgi:hypothetical protein
VSAQQDGRWRLLTVPTAGQTRPQVVMESADRLYPNAWTPDGRSLVFQERREDTGWDLRIVDVDDSGTAAGPPRDLAASPFQETGATLSQDGRYLAYDSDELDAIAGVYVAPLADPAARARASELNVRWPRWRASHELFCWYPPKARPRPITSPEGVHRIQWAAARPAGRSEPVWPDPQKAHALVSRLSVATYASYDVRHLGARPALPDAREQRPARDERPWPSPWSCSTGVARRLLCPERPRNRTGRVRSAFATGAMI